MIESDIESRLVTAVRKLGGIAYKFVSPGNTGVPDRIIIMPGGRVWFVELKTDTGRLRPSQKRQIEKIRQRGANTFVLKGMDGLQEFMRIITEESDGVQTASLSGDSVQLDNEA